MSEVTRGIFQMPFEMAMGSEVSRFQFYKAAQSMYAENRALKERLEQAEKDAAKWCLMIAEMDPKKATQLEAAVTMTMFMRKYVAGQGEGA